MYNSESFCDKGTLKHLQIVIRRSHLPKDNVGGVQEFYSLVTDAHIVSAAMSHFCMQSIDSEPQGISAPSERDKLHDFMMNIVGQLVDKHVTMLTEVSEMSNLDISHLDISQPVHQ